MRKLLFSSLMLLLTNSSLLAQHDIHAVEVSHSPNVETPSPSHTPPNHTPSTPSHASGPVAATTHTTTHLQPQSATAQFQGIQVRPYSDGLRLIFKFDRTIPYTIIPELAQSKITLHLFNVEVGYLPSALNRIGDERLRAIWLKRRDPELTILELRVGTTDLHIEHFMMDRPAALVIDLNQADEMSRITAPGSTALAMDFMDPRKFERMIASESSSIVPEDWFEPGSQFTEPQTARGHGADTEHRGEVIGTTDSMHGAEHDIMDGMVVVNDDQLDIRPRKWDYEFFPVELLNMDTPLGEEIKDLFLRRRWSSVLQKGVKEHLEVRDLSRESYLVLYMVAEARWQLGLRFNPPPYREMRNFYEQAQRAMPGSEFGAFANWRLAQEAWYAGDFGQAAARADMTLTTGDPELRKMAEMMKLEAMVRSGQNVEAIRMARSIKEQELSDYRRALIERIEGVAYAQADSPEHAWEAFTRANDLDPGWVNMDFKAAELMARTALDVGEYENARDYLKFIHEHAPYRNDEMKVKIALLYAEALMHLGEEQVAEDTYATLLSDLDKTAKGEEVLKAALKQFPDQMTNSEKLFCELLWRRGKIREAMVEFNRAFNQNLRAGINNEPMRPVIEKILPSFMEYANRNDQPFDAVQSWQYFNYAISDEKVRQRCLPALVDALEKIGMYAEAEKLYETLKANGHPRYTHPGAHELLQSGRIAYHLGLIAEAVSQLEKLTGPDVPDAQRQDALEYLAKSYENLDRKVEAAQAWQLLAEVPTLEGQKRGDALLNGAQLFLDVGMFEQAVELGIQSLYYEQQFLQESYGSGWNAETGNSLRMALARGYQERKDFNRASIILDSVLLEQGLEPWQRAEGQLMLAHCMTALGNIETAQNLLKKTADDTASPELLRNVASAALQAGVWDVNHPTWSVDWEFRPGAQRK